MAVFVESIISVSGEGVNFSLMIIRLRLFLRGVSKNEGRGSRVEGQGSRVMVKGERFALFLLFNSCISRTRR